MKPSVGAMKPTDWDAVRRIYEEGIATGIATFETRAPSWEEWDETHLTECRLVARDDNEVLGWAALSPVSDRCAYAGVAEFGVYVGAAARGRGVGKALLTALIEESEKIGYWTLQAGTFVENTASIELQLACGFRTVGTRQRLGKLGDEWHDVVLLERRSPNVGN
jgi:phosphinothricin acetyltransferase